MQVAHPLVIHRSLQIEIVKEDEEAEKVSVVLLGCGSGPGNFLRVELDGLVVEVGYLFSDLLHPRDMEQAVALVSMAAVLLDFAGLERLLEAPIGKEALPILECQALSCLAMPPLRES